MTTTDYKTAQPMRGNLEPSALLSYMRAGNAVITLESLATHNRYTYKIKKHTYKNKDDSEDCCYWVKLLTGDDNMSDYTYMGWMKSTSEQVLLSKKSTYSQQSKPVLALNWALSHASDIDIVDKIAIYHEGRCLRCGRVLTVPESIESGYGPECIRRMEA